MPVPVVVAQVPLLGQHVAHRAGFQRWQLLLVESRFDNLKDLCFGSCSQYQLGFLDREWDVESRGGRVEADRSPQFGIPKLGILGSGGPCSPHHAHETVLALDYCFETMPSE